MGNKLNSDPHLAGWVFKKYRDGSILITTSLVIISASGIFFSPHLLFWVVFILSLLLWFVVQYFFRDPDRPFDRLPTIFYSPGDGVVSDIINLREKEYLDLDFVRVGIFLSVFDVHVQRAPISGVVDFVNHQPGKNHPAYKHAASQENDQIVMGMKTSCGMIIIKQISGILARKCINYAKPGARIFSGQRYGLIKFGSRVELYLPPDANILCSVGDPVKGGLTTIAEMKTIDL